MAFKWAREKIRLLSPRNFKQMLESLLVSGMTPRQIALGVAVGSFIGVSPFIGLHTVMGIAAAYVLRLNQVVVFLGAQVVGNPLTLPLIIYLSAQIGSLIMRGHMMEIKFDHVDFLTDYFEPILLGSVVLGAVLSAALYLITLNVAKRYKS